MSIKKSTFRPVHSWGYKALFSRKFIRRCIASSWLICLFSSAKAAPISNQLHNQDPVTGKISKPSQVPDFSGLPEKKISLNGSQGFAQQVNSNIGLKNQELENTSSARIVLANSDGGKNINWNDSTNDHNWSTPGNWDGKAVPTKNDTATIGSGTVKITKDEEPIGQLIVGSDGSSKEKQGILNFSSGKITIQKSEKGDIGDMYVGGAHGTPGYGSATVGGDANRADLQIKNDLGVGGGCVGDAGGKGEMNISGHGNVDVMNNMYVGGARCESGCTYSGNGIVTVGGDAAANLNVHNMLKIGLINGTGEMHIIKNGKVDVTNNVYVGGDEGSHGIGTLTVAGDEKTIGNLHVGGNLWVGNNGIGEMTISQNGKVTVDKDMYVGGVNGNGEKGILKVAGEKNAVADLKVKGELSVCQSNTTSLGEIDISKYGKVQANSVVITPWTDWPPNLVTGSVNLSDGGELLTGSVEARQGKGQLIFNGGILTATRDNNEFIQKKKDYFDVVLNDRGGTINSNGHNIAISNTLITGSGGLTKDGEGSLILSLENTYKGNTTVKKGTLEGSTTSLRNNIIVEKDAELKFSQGTQHVDHVEFNGNISGEGNVFITSKGYLNEHEVRIKTDQNYTGTTTIEDGTLRLEDVAVGSKLKPIQLQTSNIVVNNGGTLMGFGKLVKGNVTVNSGGWMKPGGKDVPGTFEMHGDYNQKAGSNLYIRLAGTSNDMLKVDGKAYLDGNLKVVPTDKIVFPEGKQYADKKVRYTIVDTQKGVEGKFKTEDLKDVPLAMTVDYTTDTTKVFLDTDWTGFDPCAKTKKELDTCTENNQKYVTEINDLKGKIADLTKDLEKCKAQGGKCTDYSGEFKDLKDIISKIPTEKGVDNTAMLKDIEKLIKNIPTGTGIDYTATLKDIQDRISKLPTEKGVDYTATLKDIQDRISKLPTEKGVDYTATLKDIQDRISKIPTEKGVDYATTLKDIEKMISNIPTGKGIDNTAMLKDIEKMINKIPTEKGVDYTATLNEIKNRINNIPTEKGADYTATLNEIMKKINNLPTEKGVDNTAMLKDIEKMIGNIPTEKCGDYAATLNELKKMISKLPTEKGGDYTATLKDIKDLITKTGNSTNQEIANMSQEITKNIKDLSDKITELGKKNEKAAGGLSQKIDEYKNLITEINNNITNLGNKTAQTAKENKDVADKCYQKIDEYKKVIVDINNNIKDLGNQAAQTGKENKDAADKCYQKIDEYKKMIVDINKNINDLTKKAANAEDANKALADVCKQKAEEYKKLIEEININIGGIKNDMVAQAEQNKPRKKYDKWTSLSDALMKALASRGKGQRNSLYDAIMDLAFIPKDQLKPYLIQLTPEMAGHLKEIVFNNTNIRNGQITERLAAIRAGAGGISLNGVSQEPMGQQASRHEQCLYDKDGKSVVAYENTPEYDKTSPWSLFATASGVFSNISTAQDLPNMRTTTGNFTVGTDCRISENYNVGLFVGYEGFRTDYGNGSWVHSDGIQFGGYGTAHWNGFYLDAMVGAGFNSFALNRNIDLGADHWQAKCRPSGAQLNTLLGGGYEYALGNWRLGANASLQYTYLGISGYTETGAGGLDLKVGRQNPGSMLSTVGGNISYNWNIAPNITLMPTIGLAWQHQFLDYADPMNTSFNGGAGPSFIWQSAKGERDNAFGTAGVVLQVGQHFSGYVYYNPIFGGSEVVAHGVLAGLSYRF